MAILINCWVCIRLYCHAFWKLIEQTFYNQLFSIKSSELDQKRQGEDNLNRTVVVTGGSGGLGLEISERLKQIGLNVVVASKCPPPKDSVVRSCFFYLDLSSKQSVIRFAKDFKKRYGRLHYLINNAGVMLKPYTHTDFGVEGHICVNFLGHAALTELLLPTLEASASSNFTPLIANVSSSANCLASTQQVLDLFTKSDPNDYSCHMQYSLSKLAVKMYSYAQGCNFEASNRKVKVISLHPGLINSGLFDNVHPLLLLVKQYTGSYILWSCGYAADRIIDLVLDSHKQVKAGSYIGDTQSLKVFDGATDLIFAKNSHVLYDEVQKEFVRPLTCLK